MQMKKMNGHVFWLNSRAEVYISEAFAEEILDFDAGRYYNYFLIMI